jgi:hypothetical protein
MSLIRRRSKDKDKKGAAEVVGDLTGYVRELRKGTDAVQGNLDAGARGMTQAGESKRRGSPLDVPIRCCVCLLYAERYEMDAVPKDGLRVERKAARL